MSDEQGKDLNLHRRQDGLDEQLQREVDEALGGMTVDEILQAEQPTRAPAPPNRICGTAASRRYTAKTSSSTWGARTRA